MFTIRLSNNKEFTANDESSIFECAKNDGVNLEHSCLSARCKSCLAKVISGNYKELNQSFILSDKQKGEGMILTCNTVALSNLNLDITDIGDFELSPVRTIPSKVDSICYLSEDVIKLTIRIPPNSDINFFPGQYINLIKGAIKRSYSIANAKRSDSRLELFIKRYEGGEMSQYLFEEANINDLLRIEGPLGSFFFRKSVAKNIVFLATGTGIAPIKAILEDLNNSPELISGKEIWLFWGCPFNTSFYWNPIFPNLELNFVKVVSRGEKEQNTVKGHVQTALVNSEIDLRDAQVYACGSNDMITSAQALLVSKGLQKEQFFSDAFVSSF